MSCALAVCAGCGGSDSPAPADDRAAVREVMEKTEDAIFSDDPGSVCDYMTEEYQAETVEQAKRLKVLKLDGDTCEEVMTAAAELAKRFGVKKPGIGEIVVLHNTATATTTGEDPQTSRLLRTDDGWLISGEVEQP